MKKILFIVLLATTSCFVNAFYPKADAREIEALLLKTTSCLNDVKSRKTTEEIKALMSVLNYCFKGKKNLSALPDHFRERKVDKHDETDRYYVVSESFCQICETSAKRLERLIKEQVKT